MSELAPKQARRVLLELLYKSFLEDPLCMLSAHEVLDQTSIERDNLAANAYYLYDRKLVEMMIGYNPPLFAAIRIAPEGIDIVEDTERFERMFPAGELPSRPDATRVIPLMMRLAEQAENAPIEGLRKEWLLRDVSHLRDALRAPIERWDGHAIRSTLGWIIAFTENESKLDLAAAQELKALLHDLLD